MGDGNTTIPVWLQLMIFALPIMGLVIETTKYFINRADARSKKADGQPPPAPNVPVQIVTGTEFSMDREMITMLQQQMAAKDRELEKLRRQVNLYLRLLLMNDVAVPDDGPETMV